MLKNIKLMESVDCQETVSRLECWDRGEVWGVAEGGWDWGVGLDLANMLRSLAFIGEAGGAGDGYLHSILERPPAAGSATSPTGSEQEARDEEGAVTFQQFNDEGCAKLLGMERKGVKKIGG